VIGALFMYCLKEFFLGVRGGCVMDSLLVLPFLLLMPINGGQHLLPSQAGPIETSYIRTEQARIETLISHRIQGHLALLGSTQFYVE
jgi:hypothetical protein